MAVRIRLTRVGAHKRPIYRVVAVDPRFPRDGRFIEILGFYNPCRKEDGIRLDTDKIREWINKGATPSRTVTKLLRNAGFFQTMQAQTIETQKRQAQARRKKREAAKGSTTVEEA